MNCLEKEKINNNKEKYYFEIFFFPLPFGLSVKMVDKNPWQWCDLNLCPSHSVLNF